MNLLKNFKKLMLSIVLMTVPMAPALATGILNSTTNTYAATVGFGQNSLVDIVFQFIYVILGLLAIITLVLIIYAGLLWMTASGSEEKVQKAQGIIRNTIVGLFIIMASWGIVVYLSTIFGTATNTTTG
ncbi:MAG: pilin [Candidatus Kerfeldbacteria bacterium]|nr:pilin [Candidatus Kerfeldbacteria bacterium]